MTAKTDWPYDADRDDPLTALRIPVVPSHADWCYIVAFDSDSPARPDDTEALLLVSALRFYIDAWYNESYKLKLADRPFDVDGGANGITFRKYADGDWGCRRRTWTEGPLYVPQQPEFKERPVGPLTLRALLDRIYSDGDGNDRPGWAQWKTDHPDVFPQETP